MKRNQIIDTATRQFENLTSWKIKVKETPTSIDEGIDGEIHLLNQRTKEKHVLILELKNEVRTNDILKLIELKKKYPDFFLMAQYISKPNREQLRDHHINYLETSGNCYIEKDSIYIYIDNQKVEAQRKTSNSKLYTESGMRFVYAGLLNPNFVKGTYREIAAEAEIALGNVRLVMDALEMEGFLETKNGSRDFKNRNELFDVWANNFGDTMRPHLLQTRLAFANKQNALTWKNIQLKNAFWGGEPAAALLDSYLIPEQFTIYSNYTLHQMMKEYKLVPDPKGNILYMLSPFKHKELPEKADPFLIYAELIQSKDSRCLEAAKRIKEKYIDTKF
ncbi:MAG: hypothetical protein JNL24_02950 [Bacteroidia bacterium]|nr:hypothetical protein [Bacteroidia bacterium]